MSLAEIESDEGPDETKVFRNATEVNDILNFQTSSISKKKRKKQIFGPNKKKPFTFLQKISKLKPEHESSESSLTVNEVSILYDKKIDDTEPMVALGEKCDLFRSSGLPGHLAKYWAQRYRLFSRWDTGIRLDAESWYSVTPERIARHTARRCRSAHTMVDAFCGAGGNTIQFAHVCSRVIAVDINPARVQMARHNARLYGVDHKIEFIVGDFLQLAAGLRADGVFLSPPWGGPQYLNKSVYDLKQLGGGLDGFTVMAAARAVSSNIAFLVPRNTDRAQLSGMAGEGGRVEVETNIINKKAKTLTAYFGNFINETKNKT